VQVYPAGCRFLRTPNADVLLFVDIPSQQLAETNALHTLHRTEHGLEAYFTRSHNISSWDGV